MGFFHQKKTSPPSPFSLQDNIFGFLSSHPAVIDNLSIVENETTGKVGALSILPSRFKAALLILLFSFLILFGRSFQLQILAGKEYKKIAETNRFRLEVLPSERGVITDRNNVILADNSSVFSLVMVIDDLPEEFLVREKVFTRVADLTGLQKADFDLLLQDYAEVPEEEIIVCKDLDYEHALLAMVEEEELDGFKIKISTKRKYFSAANSLAHVLGYVGKINVEEFTVEKTNGYRRTDEIGKTGVELSWETYLRGKPGKRLVEVNAQGNEVTVFSEERPEKGKTLTLSIDSELQTVAERSLSSIMETNGNKRGSVIVTNPNNGEILALVSLPAYDGNLFSGGIDKEPYQLLINDPNQPLFPRAVSGEFPSGSTFKPYVAAAALAEGIITSSTSFLSTGGLNIGLWSFPDWKAGGHGVTDVRKALSESVNTFFYIIGGGYEGFTGLGVERITNFARLFGFGQKTDVDLPGEAEGFLPSKEWKEETKGERWYVGDTYHLAIGQGDLLVTPLQIAIALSMIANGGTKYVPHVVQAIDGQAVTVSGVELPTTLKEAIPIVQQGMRQSVVSGSSRRLNSLPFSSAGKTGTAQVAGSEKTHAWFTGYAPYERPQIAVTVLIEEGGQGSSTAIVVAEDIFRWWYTKQMK